MITVFTPTYNRAYRLKNLFDSLKNQTDKNFEWLIVDDGSTDNTEQLVKTFIEEADFDVRYVKQPNGGKHRAINRGVKLAKGNLFLIVDSDDFLRENAIEIVFADFIKMQSFEYENVKWGGLCAAMVNLLTGFPLGSPLTYNGVASDSLTLTFGGRTDADKCEIFFTEVLKKFPFPEIEEEKFVPEGLIWFRIAKAGYKLFCDDEGIYVCEYLTDGYSANFRKNLKSNPKGFAIFYKENLIFSEIPLMRKMKSLVRWLQCLYYQMMKDLKLS